MNVRRATPDDAEDIHEVARKSWHAAHDDIVGPETVDEALDNWYAVEDLKESSQEALAFFVAEYEDDGNVGFAHADIVPEEDDQPAPVCLFRIYIDPDYWGQGIGSELLNRVFETVSEEGYDSIYLPVMAENDVARSFYEKHGFEVHEEREVEFFGQEIEDVLMKREL